MHPLSVQITTKDPSRKRDVHYSYVLQTNSPRWELLKIFIYAFFTMKFK
jgi:hypothetical protein